MRLEKRDSFVRVNNGGWFGEYILEYCLFYLFIINSKYIIMIGF